MKGRILTESQMAAFAVYLKSEERSDNTIEKYIRDVSAFAEYVEKAKITKEIVIACAYKEKLHSFALFVMKQPTNKPQAQMFLQKKFLLRKQPTKELILLARMKLQMSLLRKKQPAKKSLRKTKRR